MSLCHAKLDSQSAYKKSTLPSVILNLIQNLSEAQVKTYTDPESTFVASACECGVAVQGDGLQVPDPMFKYCKLILAGIGGSVSPLRRAPEKERKTN